MTNTRRLTLAAALVTGMACAAPCAAATGKTAAKPAPRVTAKVDDGPIPSMEQIRRFYEQGDDQAVLRAVHRLDSLRGKAARDAAVRYDASELMEMKAEVFLRMRSVNKAVEAFELAGKLAKDEVTESELRVTALLLARAKGLKYIPPAAKAGAAAPASAKTSSGPVADKSGPVDLTDPEKRHEAFAAFYAAESPAAAAKVKAAAEARDLDTLATAVDAVRDLRVMELAATGGGDASAALGRDLVEPALRLMRGRVSHHSRRLDVNEKRATEFIEEDVYGVDSDAQFGPVRRSGGNGDSRSVRRFRVRRRRGLDRSMSRQLAEARSECRQIAGRAEALAKVAGEEGAPVAALAADAEAIAERADYVLKFDYSPVELVR